jgi:hypothetical protein
MRQQGGGAVQMEATFSGFRYGQVLQDLGLQRGTESFGLLDAVVLCGGSNSASEAEVLVEAQHFLGAEAGHCKHLEHTLGNFFPQLFEAWMCARLV